MAPQPSGKAEVCNTFTPSSNLGGASKKKDIIRQRIMSFFIDINLLRDFRYVINDAMCANALDMLPYGNEIYIISSLSKARTYRFCDNKNIEQTKSAYRLKTTASKPFDASKENSVERQDFLLISLLVFSKYTKTPQLYRCGVLLYSAGDLPVIFLNCLLK